MKVLVVDDEAPARGRLGRMLEELDGYSLCGEAATGQEALTMAEQSRPDVILMDIRMPGMDGLEAAQHLQLLEQPPAVIFTTAYDDYALHAFETHAVDYLLKPVRRQRLEEALQNANRLTRAQAASLSDTDSDAGVRQRICARVRGSLKLIMVEDIRFFQADQKYVTVGTADEQVLIEETLKSLEQEFADRFLRIHRNALIANRYLVGIEKDGNGHACARLDGVDGIFEVSRRHLAEVRKLVKSLQS